MTHLLFICWVPNTQTTSTAYWPHCHPVSLNLVALWITQEPLKYREIPPEMLMKGLAYSLDSRSVRTPRWFSGAPRTEKHFSRQSGASQTLVGTRWSKLKFRFCLSRPKVGPETLPFLTSSRGCSCWSSLVHPLKSKALQRTKPETHSNKLCLTFSWLLEFHASHYIW